MRRAATSENGYSWSLEISPEGLGSHYIERLIPAPQVIQTTRNSYPVEIPPASPLEMSQHCPLSRAQEAHFHFSVPENHLEH